MSPFKKNLPGGRKSRKPGASSSYGKKERRGTGGAPSSGSSYRDRSSGLRSKSGGDRPDRSRSTEGERFSKPRSSGGARSYGDDKPREFKSREGGEGRPSRFSKPGGRRKERPAPWKKREDSKGDAPSRKPYADRGDRPEGRERKSYSTGRRDETPGRKPYADRGDRPAGRERRGFGADRSEGAPERKPFSDRGEKPAFRERREDTRERRPYADRGEKPETRERKSFGGNRREDTTERKPFAEGEERSAPRERKSFGTARPARRDETTGKRPRTGSGDRSSGTERRGYSGDRGGDSEPRKWNRKESHEFYGERGDKKGSWGKKKSGPKSTAADDGLIRLNRYISNAGVCSRREADELIAAGVVSVNGEVVTEMGYKVKPDDVVRYNNAVLRGERLVYVLLNKPKDFITTTDDPEERKTVMNLIANAGKERIYPVGRLDRNTTGVLLFTNDGDLARKLTHPSFEVQKVYQVELDSALKPQDLEAIENGLKLEDGFIKVDEIAYVDAKDRSILGVELHSGKNRIVRRLFEHFGYKVKKLDRVIFAGLTKKDLPRGRWRFLTPMEVANLKMVTGSKKFQSAE